MKICTKCKIKKPLFEFSKDKQKKDGLYSACKKCVRVYAKSWYKEHQKLNLEYSKKYYEEHKSEVQKRHNRYYANNKEKYKINSHNWRKKNIKYKLANNLRTRLRSVLRGKVKANSTLKLLGCSIEFLKKYLESKFKQGMNWDNYGTGFNGRKEWHIDHIKPCASFDLSKLEEQCLCCNYTNLQPLWAEENWKKGDKI